MKSNSKTLAIIIFLILAFFNLNAQLDTNYVYTFKNKVSLGLKFGAIQNNFTLNNGDLKYNIKSNFVPTIAVWFKYKKLPALAIAIPISTVNGTNLAKTTGITIALRGQVAKGFIVDGFFFFEKGFNLENQENRNEKLALPNTTNLNINLELFYVFNFKKFSYKSAYLFGEIQKKSAGSFTLGLSTGFFGLHNENSIYINDSVDFKRLDFNNIYTFNISVVGGYMHTFVFGKNKKWLVNGAVFVGPNFHFGKSKYFNEGEEIKVRNVGINSKYKFSIGHNFKNWSLNFASTGTFIGYRPSKATYLNSNIIDFKISGYYKF